MPGVMIETINVYLLIGNSLLLMLELSSNRFILLFTKQTFYNTSAYNILCYSCFSIFSLDLHLWQPEEKSQPLQQLQLPFFLFIKRCIKIYIESTIRAMQKIETIIFIEYLK